MKDFEAFFQANKDKIDALAEANTKRNSAGQTVISRDDPWFYEDECFNRTIYSQRTISTQGGYIK